MIDLKIKYHSNIEHIQKIDIGDWIDLRSAEDVDLKKGSFSLINLGVTVIIPNGYEMYIAPRSSTFKKYGIIQTNSIGVIDHTYCGENDILKMPVYATRDCHINKNDRICQFRLAERMPEINIEEVEFTGHKDRNGFGSTGTNNFTTDTPTEHTMNINRLIPDGYNNPIYNKPYANMTEKIEEYMYKFNKNCPLEYSTLYKPNSDLTHTLS